MKRTMTALVLAMTVVLGGCRHKAPTQDTWGQGYETKTSTGQSAYMEPDHSFLYYYVLYHIFFSGSTQPTYHVYVAPAGSPAGYRSWHARPTVPAGPSSVVSPSAPSRSSGGFFSTPSGTQVRPSVQTPSRSTGGFSAPSVPRSYSVPAPTRSSGGFSSGSSSVGRSSGGFGGRR